MNWPRPRGSFARLRLLAARGDRLAAFTDVDWDKALAWLRSRTGAPLAPEQEQAVRLALTSRVAVLTGGPGCGKSFTVRSVVELTLLTDEDDHVDYGFDELDELTHAYAVTIHRSQGSEYPAVVIPLTMGSRKARDLGIGAGGGMNRHPRPPDPAVEPGRGHIRAAQTGQRRRGPNPGVRGRCRAELLIQADGQIRDARGAG
jgi:hypothetical protein